jgi:putative hydrolase of the HAD superfamily
MSCNWVCGVKEEVGVARSGGLHVKWSQFGELECYLMTFCLMLDVDGVLVSGRPWDGLPWVTDIEIDLGIPPELLDVSFFAPHWEKIVTGEANLAEVLKASLQEISSPLSPQELMDYWFSRDSRIAEEILEDCEVLRELGIPVFLATNQEHLRARYLMDDLGLGRHVDGIMYSAELAAKKPERAFFEAVTARTGFAPEHHVLVDDTLANVDGALAFGWQGLHWSGGSSLVTVLKNHHFLS